LKNKLKLCQNKKNYNNLIIFLRNYKHKHFDKKILCKFKKIINFVKNSNCEKYNNLKCKLKNIINNQIIHSYIDDYGVVVFNSSINDDFKNKYCEINTNSFKNYIQKNISYSSNGLKTLIKNNIQNHEIITTKQLLILKNIGSNYSIDTVVDDIDDIINELITEINKFIDEFENDIKNKIINIENNLTDEIKNTVEKIITDIKNNVQNLNIMQTLVKNNIIMEYFIYKILLFIHEHNDLTNEKKKI
jgi:hypothetical protein